LSQIFFRKISNNHVYIQLNYWQYDNVMPQYPAKLTKDGSNISVTFRDVPEAITFGANEKEALENAVDALVAGLSLYVDAGKALPKPSRVKRGQKIISLPPLELARLRLYQIIMDKASEGLGSRFV
jgi:antitoxin HicB